MPARVEGDRILIRRNYKKFVKQIKMTVGHPKMSKGKEEQSSLSNYPKEDSKSTRDKDT